MITEFSPNPFMLHEDVIEMKRTKNIEFFLKNMIVSFHALELR